ncbi:MAG TPA: MerR family transcriptional regulator [Mycobacteriales bacterium]|jgi:DNA-binding transcriptional MerR regulator|nr:MerR family transcriptional regulator [Mycobacteriales bacterium]
MAEEYTVGRVAEIAGVTVRTLHHYDEIGLVRASGRTAAGYRFYEPSDIDRLHQVLTYRRLGFALDDIAALIDDPDIDAVGHLRRQRALLVERGERISAMVTAIDKELEARAMGMQLTPEEQLEVFGTDKVGGEWAAEAEQRWGETAAFRESQRRTASYTKEDWARLKDESDAALRSFADAMRGGVAADSAAGMALAEAHRDFLTRWFYDCDHQMHRNLAEMYVADERFSATFEVVAPGLAVYVRDAVVANATAHGA